MTHSHPSWPWLLSMQRPWSQNKRQQRLPPPSPRTSTNWHPPPEVNRAPQSMPPGRRSPRKGRFGATAGTTTTALQFRLPWRRLPPRLNGSWRQQRNARRPRNPEIHRLRKKTSTLSAGDRERGADAARRLGYRRLSLGCRSRCEDPAPPPPRGSSSPPLSSPAIPRPVTAPDPTPAPSSPYRTPSPR